MLLLVSFELHGNHALFGTFLKIYSHKTKIFQSILLALYSPDNLLKHYIYALFGRLKQYFTCFDCSIILCAILLSCGIACPIIHA